MKAAEPKSCPRRSDTEEFESDHSQSLSDAHMEDDDDEDDDEGDDSKSRIDAS